MMFSYKGRWWTLLLLSYGNGMRIFTLRVCFLGNNVMIFYAVIYILKTVSVFNHVSIIFPHRFLVLL